MKHLTLSAAMVLALATAPLPSHAEFSDVSALDCINIGLTAELTMRNRQSGTPLEKLLGAIWQHQDYYWMVIMAYQTPIRESQHKQNQEVSQFRTKITVECLDTFNLLDPAP